MIDFDALLASPFLVQEISRSIAGTPYQAHMGAEAVARSLDSLPKGSRVDLYGCGNLGHIMATQHAVSLRRHRLSFLTTHEEGTAFHGFPKRNITAMRQEPAEHVFILSCAYEVDMLKNLRGHVPDGAIYSLAKVIQGNTEWSPHTLAALMADIEKYLSGFIADIEDLARRKGKVVCIAVPRLLPHLPKFISELHSRGVGVALYVECDALGSGTIRDLQDDGYYDYALVARYSYALELYLLSLRARLHVIHSVIGSWSNMALAFLAEHAGCPVVAEYCDFIPIVFDSDADAITYFCRTPESHAQECNALRIIHTKADGIIHKDSQEGLDAVSKVYGGQSPRKSLHYMPYCGNRFSIMEQVEKYSSVTDRIHIVHAGGMVNNHLWHNYKPFCSQLQAARWLDMQGMAFHLFNASDTTGEGYEDYYALQNQLRYFQYNLALPYARLSEVLPRYDYAWFVFDYTEATETELYRVTGIGSKIFSHLEAGLPVLSVPRLKFQHEFIMDNGIGVAVDYPDIPRLADILRKVDYQRLLENIARARAIYSHEINIGRMIDFYEGLHILQKGTVHDA